MYSTPNGTYRALNKALYLWEFTLHMVHVQAKGTHHLFPILYTENGERNAFFFPAASRALLCATDW